MPHAKEIFPRALRQPFLRLKSNLWESGSFIKVPDCSQTQISEVLKVQEKGSNMIMSECHQSSTLTQTVG
jgi:predicted XRE-type DNA-binding protein